MKKVIFNNKTRNMLFFILSIFTSFSFLVNLDEKIIIRIIDKNTNTLLYLVLIIFFFKYYQKCLKNHKRTSFIILSVIFSLLLIFGYSFEAVKSPTLVYGNYIFIIISFIKLIGFSFFWYTALNLLYDLIGKYKFKNGKSNRFMNFFINHTFICSIIILLIFYIPYLIAFYPGTMLNDTVEQIKEYLGMASRYKYLINPIDDRVILTNFNPVLHTLIVGRCFKLGLKIGNVNFGIFIYTFIQMMIFIMVLAYSIDFLKEEGVNKKVLIIILLIYALLPIFPFFAIFINKDTYFTLFIFLYIIELYKLLQYKPSKRSIAKLVLTGLFICLFRNNGIYMILLSLPFFLILEDKRIFVLIGFLSISCLYLCYSKVLLPCFKISPTSIREALSLPFQQTAALAKYDENVIDKEDREKINKILNYEDIKEYYIPNVADPVKRTFNKDYTKEELNEYFKVWFKYLLKRPLIYIDATINNAYMYFYPNTRIRGYIITTYTNQLKGMGYDYHFNNCKYLRKILKWYVEAFQKYPILELFVNIGLYVWIYFYLVCYIIIKKKKKYILLLLPALSLILVCVASPVNGYLRYAMGYMFTLPLVISLVLVNTRK